MFLTSFMLLGDMNLSSLRSSSLYTVLEISLSNIDKILSINHLLSSWKRSCLKCLSQGLVKLFK